MSIYLWNSEPSKIYVGSNEVSAVYVWTTKVRPTIPVPTNWLLWYRPLQSDLLDYSGNGNNGSWYSWTGTFSTNASKTGARVTYNSSYTSTQHIVTPITYSGSPITMCWWICFNAKNTSRWEWLMTNQPTAESEQWWTLWLRPYDNNYPYVNAHWKATIRINNSTVSLNTWYFWCVTWNWNTVTTYFNWTQTNTWSVSSITNWYYWRLWCASTSTNLWISWTDWWVRHCAVYNRVLSASEVTQYYNNTL